jgi:hypothetical protein
MRLRTIFVIALLFALATGTFLSPELFATGKSKPTPKPAPPPGAVNPPAPAPPPNPGAPPGNPPAPAPHPPNPAPAPAPGNPPAPAPPRPDPIRSPVSPPASSAPRWSNPATWPGGRVPTRDNDVVIPAGRVVEVDTLTAEARTVTVDGTLRASRSGASRLTVHGNLIVRNQGALDYGTPTDRVQALAAIRFFLDEARVVGGTPAGPMESDVGLWAIDDSRVFVHGSYRDAWSPLAQTARAGSIEIQVDPSWARGWRAGDLVLIGPSNLRTSDNDFQDEVRRITADVGGGRYQLDAALRFNHEVLSVPWTDAWGIAHTERLAAKVANLTSNVTFEAGDPDHRPHIIFLERAKHYVEDLAVINFSPMPTQNPMARYAWHDHMQGDGSRGSYLRRARIYGGPGIGLSVHESYGVEVEDVVIYNQARAYVERGGRRLTDTTPLLLERTRSLGSDRQHHAADDCWIDRPLVVRWGTNFRDYRNAGIWLTGSVNCPVMGAVTAGGAGQVFSSGIHWDEGGGGGENPYLYRAETNSNRMAGVLSWQNNTPAQPIVDLLTWRNGETGIMWGAYGTRYWGFQFRALGNGSAQLSHTAARWGITGFLADGMGVSGTTGIRVGTYFSDSNSDSVYEDGVVRGVATNLAHIQTSSSGETSWVQFARIRWDAGRPIRFGPSNVPPLGSRFRIRQQTGLSRPSDFTLYRRDDSGAPGSKILDLEFNALRWDNDAQGTRGRAPRIAWAGSLADDSVATGSVTLTVQTDASEVEFYQANHSLGRAQVTGGFATMTFNMGGHPRRRAYFWAAAARNGALSTTRVLRLMKH